MASILFVDDDAYMLSAYQRMMRQSPYQCFFLQHPEQFWQQSYIEQLNVVLVDQQMPLLTGTELLLQIQQRLPELKRVLISGDVQQARLAVNSGVELSAALDKPCSKAVLEACLQRLIPVGSANGD